MSDRPTRWEFDASQLTTRVDLTLPGDVTAIAPAVERIMEAVREMGCASEHVFEIEIALTEALANAVVHGCGRDPSKSVQVCAGCDPSRGILIVVRDPGPGFDPEAIPSPVVGEGIYRSGGRGIFLINELMDTVSLRRGGAEIWMRKR